MNPDIVFTFQDYTVIGVDEDNKIYKGEPVENSFDPPLTKDDGSERTYVTYDWEELV